MVDNAGVSTQQKPKRYVQHADELLSERIEQPAMKGNALVATIDHKPCVIYIDEQSADAYYQGNFDRSVEQQEQQQLSRGIK